VTTFDLFRGVTPGPPGSVAELANYARGIPANWTGSPENVAAALDAAAARIVAAEARIVTLEALTRVEGFGQKTGGTTRTLATLITDPDFATASLPGNSEGYFSGAILFNPTAAGDFQMGFFGPANIAWDIHCLATAATGSNQFRAAFWSDEASPSFGWNTANAVEMVTFQGIVRTTDSSSGAISVQWAPNVGGNSTTAMAGSWARLIQIVE